MVRFFISDKLNSESLNATFVDKRRNIENLGSMRLPPGAEADNLGHLCVYFPVFGADVLLLFYHSVEHLKVALKNVVLDSL